MDIKISEAFRNASFIAIMLVLAIHYGDLTTPEISHGSVNYFIQDFIQNGIARAAVPLFAFISGYLLCYKSDSYVNIINKRMRSLAIPYIISSLFALACYIVIHRGESYSTLGILKSIFIIPVNGQLWFIRDLIVIAFISPVIFLLSQNKILYLFFIAVIFVLWILEIQPLPIVGWYIINLDVLLFFMSGFIAHKYISDLKINEDLCRKLFFATLIAWFIFTFVRCYIDPEFDLWYTREFTIASLALQKASIVFGVACLLLLCYCYKINIPKSITSVSFFVFLFHNYPFVPLSRTIFSTLGEYRFYVTAPLFACLFIIAGITLRKISPRIYGFVSGGR
ncbi:acyltransferase [Enterobacter cloacae]|uniref:acyltransferase family protein n=1 Tax=Enterobacter cloacae TaxID=550 RepID=UPI0020044F5D|nr:acyltransferase [Enterobacter cloacae]MCK7175951.1 acyltransferase [Enterobacter cloacae]